MRAGGKVDEALFLYYLVDEDRYQALALCRSSAFELLSTTAHYPLLVGMSPDETRRLRDDKRAREERSASRSAGARSIGPCSAAPDPMLFANWMQSRRSAFAMPGISSHRRKPRRANRYLCHANPAAFRLITTVQPSTSQEESAPSSEPSPPPVRTECATRDVAAGVIADDGPADREAHQCGNGAKGPRLHRHAAARHPPAIMLPQQSVEVGRRGSSSGRPHRSAKEQIERERKKERAAQTSSFNYFRFLA